jgi:hypothetical protein
MVTPKKKSESGYWTVELAGAHDSAIASHRYLPGEHTVSDDLKAEMEAVEGLVTHVNPAP